MRGLLFVMIVMSAGAAYAAPHGAALRSLSAPPALQHVADRQISVGDAARIAQREVGGRVLAAERATDGGRPVVRVKLLTPRGVVRVITVDAITGRVR